MAEVNMHLCKVLPPGVYQGSPSEKKRSLKAEGHVHSRSHPQSFVHLKNLPTIPRAIHTVTTASLTWRLLAFFSRVWHAAQRYKPRIDKGHRLTVLRHIAPWGDLPRSEQLTDFTLPGFREIPISIQGQQPCFISHLNSFFFFLLALLKKTTGKAWPYCHVPIDKLLRHTRALQRNQWTVWFLRSILKTPHVDCKDVNA